MSHASYVYAVVRRTRKPALARAPEGLPGARPAELLKLDARTWIVAAEVPLETYGPGALESSLRDLDWVSRIALAHEALVEFFVRQAGAAVIPMKLFTLFSSGERAAAEMRSRRRELDRVFARIAGCEEWGVRVVRGDAARRPRPTATAKSGAAFLAARKQVRDDTRAAAVEALDAAEVAYSSLSAIARDGRRRTDRPAGSLPPLLDAAFLVPARRRARFHAAASRLADAVARSGGRLTVTGPWPPYNFVAAEEAG